MPSTNKRTQLTAWALSDPGSRDYNEDAFLIFQSARQSVVSVCDGMGGHAAGEVASGLAVKAIQDFFTRQEKEGLEGTEPSACVKDGIDTANRTIHQDAKANPAREGMGSTCVVGLIRTNKLYLGHVGDSRAYLVRGGGIRQLTRDHSFVEEMVKAGMITPHETHSNPQRNVILQSLGRNENVNVELSSEAVTLKVGDYVLLCSDGLTAVVADQEIAESVTRYVEPQAICEFLVDLTNQRGAPDNVTVALVRFDGLANEGPRVTVLCDDEESADLYRVVLNREGYQLDVSSKQISFTDDTDKPRLIVLDFRADPDRALQACKELGANEATAKIPVLLVNHGGFSDEAGRGAGANQVLSSSTLLTDLTPTARLMLEESSSLIYILEEDAARAKELVRSLRQEGFIVFTHTSAAALEKAIEKAVPKMLILDITRGVERICQDLKTNPQASQCPLVLSAPGSVASPREAFQLGADYYLTQPVQIAQLAIMLLNK